MSRDCNEILLKVVILGDSGVGKTSLMHRLVKRNFSSQYRATIGVNFLFRTMRIKDQTVTLQIWDTAGQERFKSLGVTFYRGADCCVIVYDVTSKTSFESVSSWYNEFLLQCSCSQINKIPFVVIGNKVDISEKCFQVDLKKAKEWCDFHHLNHVITSAYTGLNVDQVFLFIQYFSGLCLMLTEAQILPLHIVEELAESALRCKSTWDEHLSLPRPIKLQDFDSSLKKKKGNADIPFKCLC